MSLEQRKQKTVTDLTRAYLAFVEEMFRGAGFAEQQEISAQVADLNARFMAAVVGGPHD
jgi:hypothetical protein